MRLPILLLTIAMSMPLAAQTSLTVDTTQGQVRGATTEAGLRVFRGIPYAAPPVGDNRWREPQAPESWQGVRDATAFAPRCLQNAAAPGTDPVASSEDCLYLNVWTGNTNTEALQPVIVWIHGGGFTSGAGSNPGYDGENLAKHGAVVVTFNYRLGSFGFFSHPALSAESPNASSGNYGVLDMVAVLEWVYENIEAFGGDPINVSIVGESAGAQSVATLLASPRAAGLFHRAILQSGGWMGLGLSALPTLAQREAKGSRDAQQLGLTTVDQLRALPAEEALEKLPGGRINVDGYLLPRDPSLIYLGGQQQPVDVLVGSNANEAAFFGPGIRSSAALREYAQTKYGELSAEFLQLYPADSDDEAKYSFQRAFSDELAWQMRQLAWYQGRRGLGAYVYYFTRVPPGQEDRGATHASELPYMFNQTQQNPQWTEQDTELSELMATYWVNFATSTNPNQKGLPNWPAYRSHDVGNVMVFGERAMRETQQEPPEESLAFFDKAFQRLLRSLP